MSAKKNIHVVPHADGWATRNEGAGRVGSIHNTQADAINRAKEQAVRQESGIVIHRRNGQIRDSDSYGNESPIKDNKF